MPSAETTQMRRLVGKVAFLLAFVYLLVLFGAVVTLAQDQSVRAITWPLLIVPAAAFAPAVYYAIQLHRAADPERMKSWWRQCALYTAIGLILLIADAVILNQVN